MRRVRAFRAAGIHGDLDQAGRMAALADFRAGRTHVLVATDVASRGLDIKSIRTVVSLDAPRDIDTHVHRIGRTGRAGDRDGVAYTLVTPGQAKFAGAAGFELDLTGLLCLGMPAHANVKVAGLRGFAGHDQSADPALIMVGWDKMNALYLRYPTKPLTAARVGAQATW